MLEEGAGAAPLYREMLFPFASLVLKLPLCHAGGVKSLLPLARFPTVVGMGFAFLHLSTFVGDVSQAGDGAQLLACIAFPMESSQFLIFPWA